VTELIKDLMKPVWKSGRLTREVRGVVLVVGGGVVGSEGMGRGGDVEELLSSALLWLGHGWMLRAWCVVD
jgi:hypothetical protein